jgi:hypothetical protein
LVFGAGGCGAFAGVMAWWGWWVVLVGDVDLGWAASWPEAVRGASGVVCARASGVLCSGASRSTRRAVPLCGLAVQVSYFPCRCPHAHTAFVLVLLLQDGCVAVKPEYVPRETIACHLLSLVRCHSRNLTAFRHQCHPFQILGSDSRRCSK